MQAMLQTDINFAFATLLLFIALIAYFKLDKHDSLSRFYIITAFIIVVQLIIEAFTSILDYNTKPFVIHIRFMLSMFLFLVGPFLALYWYMLLKKMLVPKQTKKWYRHLYIVLPQTINLFLVLLTPFTGWIFYIDALGVYTRGFGFYITTFITYFYMVLTIINIYKNRKTIGKGDYYILLIASILPVIGGVLQIIFYGLLFIWPSVAAALIILYMFLQQRVIHHDFLTDAWTRESFFFYIDQKIRSEDEQPCGALYFDLDNLKEINDHFGHAAGDVALIKTAEIAKTLIGHNGILARLGGDEFIAIFDANHITEVEAMVMHIYQEINEFNSTSNLEFQLSISIGYDLFEASYETFEPFINKLDRKMYENKNEKKVNKKKS